MTNGPAERSCHPPLLGAVLRFEILTDAKIIIIIIIIILVILVLDAQKCRERATSRCCDRHDEKKRQSAPDPLISKR